MVLKSTNGCQSLNRKSHGGEQTLAEIESMPHKSSAHHEIARRYVRVKQPAEHSALLIVLVALG